MTKLLLVIAAIAVVLIIISILHPVGKKVSLYFILGLIALIMLLPFFMMFVMATLKTNEIYSFPPIMWFGSNLAENFKNMTATVNFPKSFLNSVIVTGSHVILVLFFCSIGGYAFSVYDFPGSKAIVCHSFGNNDDPCNGRYYSLVYYDEQVRMGKRF